MSQLVFGHDRAVADWVLDRIPHMQGDSFGACTAIGIDGKNGLMAGVVYHGYHAGFRTLQLSMAADNPMWARKSTIKALLHYPFEQLGIYKLWTCTPIENEAALRVNLHIGFKREATVAHQFGPKRHAVICRILKPDYDRIYGG